MTHIRWKAQHWLWSLAANLIPTCFLQWELAKRPGVKAQVLGPDQAARFHATGPCTVTINHD